jgi:hypothetical protein
MGQLTLLGRLDCAACAPELSAVLSRGVRKDARRLARYLRRSGREDLQASLVLGRVYYRRAEASSSGRNRAMRAAVRAFVPCFIAGLELPAPMIPRVADAVGDLAVDLLEQAANSARPELMEDAAELWQRILDATPANYPDRTMRLSNLGVALKTWFERGGDLVHLDAMPLSLFR